VVRILDADAVKPVADIPTRISARTMALDPASHRVYLAAAIQDDRTAAAPQGATRYLPGSFGILVVEPGAAK